MTLVAIIGFFTVLFVLAFATKRRFGVLGLALATGALLAQYTTGSVGALLAQWHVTIGMMSYEACAMLLVTVLPSLMLLAGGPTYADRKMVIVGAFGFALLATFFVLAPLMSIAPVADAGTRTILVTLMTYKTTVVIAGLLLAITDTFLVHGVAGRHMSHDKH